MLDGVAAAEVEEAVEESDRDVRLPLTALELAPEAGLDAEEKEMTERVEEGAIVVIEEVVLLDE